METPTKSSYSPSNILARLEELKKWQQAQQERLIQKQKEQRELLSNEQRRMYEAFGLNLDDSSCVNTTSESVDNSDKNISDLQLRNDNQITLGTFGKNKDYNISTESDASYYNSDDDYQEIRVDLNQPKPEIDEKDESIHIQTVNFNADVSQNKSLFIDEIPIKTSQKRFDELIEEHLETNIATNVNKDNKPKRPFLKRGQGLARFRMTNGDLEIMRNKAKEKSVNQTKPNTSQNAAKLINNKQCSNNSSGKKSTVSVKTPANKMIPKKRSLTFNDNTKKSAEEISKQSVKHVKTKSQIINPEKNIVTKQLKSNKQENKYPASSIKPQPNVLPSNSNTTWSKILRIQNEPKYLQEIDTNRDLSQLPQHEFTKTDKSHAGPVGKENQISSVTDTESDISLATCEKLINELQFKKDQEELKIFELLEEKAENSSFCSTNSTVQRLLTNSMNSTPKLDRLRSEVNRFLCSDTDSTPACSPQKSRRPFIRNRKNINKMQVHFEDVDGTTIYNKTETDHETTAESESYTSIIITSGNEVIDPEKAGENSDSKYFNDDTVWSDNYSDLSSEGEQLNTTLTDKNEIQTSKNHDKKQIELETKQSVPKVMKESADIITKEPNRKQDDEFDIVFKSALLKSRLQELESEIEIFRTENMKLSKRKEDFDSEKKLFMKKKLETEKQLAEEKVRNDFFFEEEKKKLAKEKMVFEKYVKESKNNPNRKEREEIASLKQEVAELKEEIKVKDSRHGAAQARLRNQIKNLEKEITNLKSENESLKKENKKLESVRKTNAGLSNTKMLHEINKNLSKIIPHELKLRKSESNKMRISQNLNQTAKTAKSVTPRSTRKVSRPNTPIQIENCDSETSEAISNYDSETDEESFQTKASMIETSARNAMFPTSTDSETHAYFQINGTSAEDIIEAEVETEIEMSRKIELEYEKMFGKRNSIEKNITDSKNSTFDSRNSTFDSKNSTFDCVDNMNTKLHDTNNSYTNCHNFSDFNMSSPSLNTSDGKEHMLETICPDGKREIHYSNGNIKTVSPDGKLIKVMYYNGDVKETNTDTGIIRYFYAETKTWHTTYIDGMEILEFENGQIEKKCNDGSYEIKFPDKSVKYIDAEGNEKLEYPDGSTMIINTKGEKVITLINGQREIHTKDHKRREYPDGTVKILYPDSTTETRYFNGRIRIRDKDGHLIMDTGAL